MNDRKMFGQTSAKQTNAQTQAKQLKKQMESAGRRSPPKESNVMLQDNNAKGNVDCITTYSSTTSTKQTEVLKILLRKQQQQQQHNFIYTRSIGAC